MTQDVEQQQRNFNVLKKDIQRLKAELKAAHAEQKQNKDKMKKLVHESNPKFARQMQAILAKGNYQIGALVRHLEIDKLEYIIQKGDLKLALAA